MVISFSSDPAFNFLDRHGFVFTFRKNRRKNPDGRTWLNRGRGESKEFDVFIREVGEVSPSATELVEYAPFSGFEDPFHWIEEIMELNDEVPDTGYLYLVTKIPEDSDTGLDSR